MQSVMIEKRQYQFERSQMRQLLMWLILLQAVLIISCGGETAISKDRADQQPPTSIPHVRYTIQVGAFANINNAVRLTARLQNKGLTAYHFLHDSGLFKVRFGNYSSKKAARRRAENLKTAGVIDVYYIVGPDQYAADKDELRENIITTANRYVGIPYRWGGESVSTGFDCSGLTMVVYRLNGLELPRSSKKQWKVGKPIKRRELAKGDLVFFATSGGTRVSHVGIYTGDNKFLHAPGRGRKITTSSMSNSYFKSRYLGARTYL